MMLISSLDNLKKEEKEFDNVLYLFRRFLGCCLKGNNYLKRAVITRVVRIAKASLFSDLNNLNEYSILDEDFAPFYGLTKVEVKNLLKRVGMESIAKNLKKWYNGYNIGEVVLYNPWSVMKFLASGGVFKNYWIDTGGTGLIETVLVSDAIQHDLAQLLEGKEILMDIYPQISFEDLRENRDVFYSMLLFAGYLKAISPENMHESEKYRLKIPNIEVRKIYVQRVKKWARKKLGITSEEYDYFISLLTTKQFALFKEKLKMYLSASSSYHDLSKERDYHNLMGGLLSPLVLQYVISSNIETLNGRCDHKLVPQEGRGNDAFVIEYKVCDTMDDLDAAAKYGMKQIKERKYKEGLATTLHVKTVSTISIAFFKKELAMCYEIDDGVKTLL